MPAQAITRLPRHRPAIITSQVTEPPDIFAAADERLAASARWRDWLPWAWGAAVLLHVLAIAVALFMRERPLPQEQESPPGISMVFDNGGAQQTMAPPAPVHGPPQPAQAPSTPPPPPPPASQQPEVNLNMPLSEFATLPPPPPQARPQPAPRPRPAPPHYAMMLNGMSYGSTSPLTPAPPAHRALNLDLAQTNAQAVMGPEMTVKGDIGADWDAELDKWVNDHKYYPQAAAEQNQQGTVEIEFTVDRKGNVTGLHMLNGSGSPFLDQAWLGLFANGAQLPPFPPGTTADHTTVDATMQYILEAP